VCRLSGMSEQKIHANVKSSCCHGSAPFDSETCFENTYKEFFGTPIKPEAPLLWRLILWFNI
jgi:hypothetical protein